MIAALVIAAILVIGFGFDPIGYTIPDQDSSGNQTEAATATVTRVVDGDTLDVQIASSSDTVRLIGVDTPEIAWPSDDNDLTKPEADGCYALEAWEYVKQTVKGKQIRLESDGTQPMRDTYDRRLAYVFIEDQLLNQQLIAEGYGKELTVNNGYEKRASFKRAETLARENGRGLWGKCE